MHKMGILSVCFENDSSFSLYIPHIMLFDTFSKEMCTPIPYIFPGNSLLKLIVGNMAMTAKKLKGM